MAMSDKEAHEIVRTIRDETIAECASIHQRIIDLKKEQEDDPSALFPDHIAKLEAREVKKVKYAEALSIAVSKF